MLTGPLVTVLRGATSYFVPHALEEQVSDFVDLLGWFSRQHMFVSASWAC